jgi:hypothetical protein
MEPSIHSTDDAIEHIARLLVEQAAAQLAGPDA